MSKPVAMDLSGVAKIHYMVDKHSPMMVELNTDNDGLLERVRCHPYFFLQNAQQPGPGLPNGLCVLFRTGGYIRHITKRRHLVEGKVIEVYSELPDDVFRVPIRSTLSEEDRYKPCYWEFPVPPHIRKDHLKQVFRMRVGRAVATNMQRGDLLRLGKGQPYVLSITAVKPVKKNNGMESLNWVWVHAAAPPWVDLC